MRWPFHPSPDNDSRPEYLALVCRLKKRYPPLSDGASESIDVYIESRFIPQLAAFTSNRNRNAIAYSVCQYALVIVAAVATGLVSLSYIYQTGYFNVVTKIAALAASVMVTILTSLIKTFNYQEKWINYSIIQSDLEGEIARFYAGVGEYATTAAKRNALFKANIEAILIRADDVWQAIHRPERGQATKEKQLTVDHSALGQNTGNQEPDLDLPT